MSEYVWHSCVMIGSVQGTEALDFLADDPDREDDRYLEIVRALERGAPLGPDELPKQLCLRVGRRHRPKEIKYLNYAGIWVIHPDVAEIFKGSELGGGGVYPVELLDTDQKTPLPGEFFILVIGNTKNTIDYEASSLRHGLSRKKPRPPYPGHGGAIKFKPEALTGPDLWMEEHLPDAVFFSGWLGDALIKAKRDKRFSLERCPVL
ncbi:MAG: DUF1629 domain-containing protein [Pseudomonadota bacterium]